MVKSFKNATLLSELQWAFTYKSLHLVPFGAIFWPNILKANFVYFV